jgi:Fe2+ transport system protein FeoA
MEALNLRLFEDGRYEVELALRPIDPAMQARLLSLGFVAGTGGAYVLRKRGAF